MTINKMCRNVKSSMLQRNNGVANVVTSISCKCISICFGTAGMPGMKLTQIFNVAMSPFEAYVRTVNKITYLDEIYRNFFN